MKIPYKKARKWLNSGDICLLKGKHWYGPIPQVGLFISWFCGSYYTHAGCITIFKQPYVIEFKEFIGFQEHPIIYLFDDYDEIDIYRIKSPLENNMYIPHKVINELRNLKIHNYSWRMIYELIKWRLFSWRSPLLQEEKFICSSAIAHAVGLHYTCMVPNKPIQYVTPADLSRCALLEYKFTIVRD